jgi:hypothetical protein
MTTQIRRLICTTAFIVACGMIAEAQTDKQDVLYLKNGSIIRGMIVQFIPDSTIKIQTIDGSLFVFPSLEIEKIQKEDAPLAAGTKAVLPAQQKDINTAVSIFGGIAIPGSDFAEGAETGFTFGVQVHSKMETGVLMNISYSSNPSPGDETWTSYIVLIGLKASLKKTEITDLYLAPLFGLYVQRISDFSVSAFAYGGMLGYQFSDRVGMGMQIVAANPEYTASVYGFGSVTAKLSTSMVHVFVAVTL